MLLIKQQQTRLMQEILVYDYFNYDVYDGSLTDTAVITIRVIGVNDDVTAVNDYGVVTEDATI